MTNIQDVATEPKFCINCEHIGTNSSRDIDTYRCFAPQNFAGYNLIDGSRIYTHHTCASCRYESTDRNLGCDMNGNWFEVKLVQSPQPLPVMLQNQAPMGKARININKENLADLLGM